MVMIGIDLGTTGCKCIAMSEKGTILDERYFEYDLVHTPEGWILQDAEQWWRLVQQAVSEAVQNIGHAATAAITGLSVSSQGISVVPVDAKGRVLDMAISWLDIRAIQQADTIARLFGEQDIYWRTGKRVSPTYTLPKIMWLKQHKPEVYKQTVKFLLPLDYINERLTGYPLTDYAMASGTMAFNIRTGQWDADILRLCGIDPDKLPPVAVTGSLVGFVQDEVANKLGLPPHTRVFLGTQDQKCAALAAGISMETATISLGTASAISTMSNRPQNDEQMRVPCFALGLERWVLESVIGTACVSLKWLHNIMTPELSYSEMDHLAASIAPGAAGVKFYPHMEGAGSPFWRDDLHGSFHGLSLSTDKGHLIRALLEGVAYQIRTNLMVQEEITRIPIKELRLFGGGSRSSLWCQLIANITNRPVLQMQAELANYGAVLLAEGGLRKEKGETIQLESIKVPIGSYQPDREQAACYQELYALYRETEEKIMRKK